MTEQQPEIDPLDQAKLSEAYILVKISVDDVTGDNPDKDYMLKAAQEYAQDLTMQCMTDRAIVTYEATVLESFVWYETEEELKAAQEKSKKQ